jgi:hypothetical protein
MSKVYHIWAETASTNLRNIKYFQCLAGINAAASMWKNGHFNMTVSE